MVKTKDKGYLVGGFFNKYQGYVKKSIAKVDSNGQVQPQYFTSAGPDSTVYGDSFVAVTVIKKAKYGGYYVGGDFLKWDDKASQPIIRITEQQVDVGYNETFEPNYSTEIEIFPNPNNGIFTVRSNSTIRTVKIYTLTGTLIVTENPLRKIFNLNFDAENGIYFAKIELDNGRVISKKIIKN